ncbi:MAG: hypothetical protein BRC28_01650 [Nanohaloarchaea archaeon SW_4_43_9]|nr:MAG: hypothetical protein BRC28_01650 [Nanohaloarchaea archaeon SW_4_43_9]
MPENWRYLPFQRYDPYFKTGLNKALMESVREESSPVAFLAGWDKKCVNLGYSQSFEDEVNTEEFRSREDIVLVRRQGGGGTTYLKPEGEITWGIVAPVELFPDSINSIYKNVCGKIAGSLSEIRIDAEHEPVNDIVTENGKISGATLKQGGGVVDIGGTLLYENDPAEMFSLLTPDEDKLKDKQIEKFKDRVTSVKQESIASFEETAEALKNGVLKGKKFRDSELRDSETERAKELANKYSGEDWLCRK